MVVDMQKVKTRSESRRYSVASRLEVRAGRLVKQAGTASRKQGDKRCGRAKERIAKAGARKKNTLVDLKQTR